LTLSAQRSRRKILTMKRARKAERLTTITTMTKTLFSISI
jgi:hypothetical protein